MNNREVYCYKRSANNVPIPSVKNRIDNERSAILSIKVYNKIPREIKEVKL